MSPNEIAVAIVVIVVAVIVLLPTIIDAPLRRRRRHGITIWDEMWARGEITTEQLLKVQPHREKKR